MPRASCLVHTELRRPQLVGAASLGWHLSNGGRSVCANAAGLGSVWAHSSRCRSLCNNTVAAAAGEAEPIERWPDGTPKKFRGKEAWKNWIKWDNDRFAEQTDELNRLRHFFFAVDERGRLWRKVLGAPTDAHEGQIRDSRTLDFFLKHVQTNRTGLYYKHERAEPAPGTESGGEFTEGAAQYSHLCMRAHEHYFCWPAVTPVVFNDLHDGMLRHLCPDQNVAKSISTFFEPQLLRLCVEGRLYHPVITTCGGEETAGDEPRRKGARETALALIESTTAMRILADGDRLVPDSSVPSGYRLSWQGTAYELLQAADILRPLAPDSPKVPGTAR